MSLYEEEARLYDIAFSWDVGPEVDWLLSRLGPGMRTVLEPGCGSGRLFPAFTARGVDVSGVDLSEAMLARAAELMARAGHAAPRTVRADMARFDLGGGLPEDEANHWEAEADGVRVRTAWGSRGFDPGTGVETQFSRIEVLSGPLRGRVFEELHPILLWDWKEWISLIRSSPFRQAAAYDGNHAARPAVPVDESLERVRLAWHELVKV